MVAKMVADRPVLSAFFSIDLCSPNLHNSPNVRSFDLPSGDPRNHIQCTARYLSELNSVSWPGQPVSGLTRRRSGRKVVEGRRWRGLNGQSHPRSFPRAPVRPGAGNSIMASSVTSSSPHLAVVANVSITPSQAAQDAEFLAALERQFAEQRPEATRPRA